jgi:hypothetical protein
MHKPARAGRKITVPGLLPCRLVLKHAAPRQYLFIRPDQHHIALLIRHAQREYLRQERADLFHREVHDCQYQAARELLLAVMSDNPGRRPFDTELRAKVNRQFIRGLTRLREILCADNTAGPDVDLFKIRVSNHPAKIKH